MKTKRQVQQEKSLQAAKSQLKKDKADLGKLIRLSPDRKLTSSEKRRLSAAVKKAKRDGRIPKTAQQTIPYQEMCRDGICVVNDHFFTKQIQFYDINYQLAQNDDKNQIFENYCDFLNYFDASIHFQLSFLNQRVDMEEYKRTIDISPTSDQYINPMDLTLNYSEDDNPLTLKSDFILSLCELIVGGKSGLEPVEKTIIDRCVHMVYREYLQDPIPEKMPILGDLYQLLREQPEKEAQRLATALEIYVTGSLNVFNHRTNVKIKSRIVCYVIKKLGKQLKKFGMQVVQDQVWGRVSENREQKKSTRLYIDEMHLLLKEEQTAAYTVEIWKRFRKWGGIPTGITQNVKDLLSSREIENIFENSDFIYMLNQAAGDRSILARQLNISPHQLSYVTNSNAGEGLLFYGNVIIPFVDHFPKDTELYSIMTTRPEDLAEQVQ